MIVLQDFEPVYRGAVRNVATVRSLQAGTEAPEKGCLRELGLIACEKRVSTTPSTNHQSSRQHPLGIKQKVDCVDEKFSSPGRVCIWTIASA